MKSRKEKINDIQAVTLMSLWIIGTVIGFILA